MIVYNAKIQDFLNQCSTVDSLGECIIIGDEIAKSMRNAGITNFDISQEKAWRKSLPFVADAISKSKLDRDIDVAIEYKINQQKTRIDFLIYGLDEHNKQNVVVVELKQWSNAQISKKPEFVFANVAKSKFEDHWHPSYQAKNYANSLHNFNVYIRETPVILNSCSFLHNMPSGNGVIMEDANAFPLIKSSPCFIKDDTNKLIDFLERYIKKPSHNLLYSIDNSQLIPSDLLSNMLKEAIEGNDFFSYDDAQRNAVSTIIAEVNDAKFYNYKATIIVKGGAGTGKSVVAINTLGQLLNPKKGKKINAAYFTANGAPRYLYTEELMNNDYKKIDIKQLFKNPQVLDKCKINDFDCGLFDEAHRIYDFKGGTGLSKDAHILEKTIRGCQVSVFFIDEDQAVTKDDYATIEIIKKTALKEHSKLIMGPELELTSQYRCLGGESYTSFIKSFLGYTNQEVTKFDGSKNKYDFRIFDSPNEMMKEIKKLDLLEQNISSQKANQLVNANTISGKCRIVAGYTHNWVSKGEDRSGPSFDFIYADGLKAKWNLFQQGEYSWLNDPQSVEEIGCIHTCQGLDMNYCGVIIGRDLLFRNGKIQIDTETHPSMDKAFCKNTDRSIVKKLIRNTYNVLLTRGIKGTFVYCEDKALNDYLKSLTIGD